MGQKEVDSQVEYYLRIESDDFIDNVEKSNKLRELAEQNPSQDLLDKIFLFHLPDQRGGYSRAKEIAELGVSEGVIKEGINIFLKAREDENAHRWLRRDSKKEAIALLKILLKKEDLTHEDLDKWRRENL